MRIAFLGDGSLNHVRRWAGFFAERGHDVLLISFEDTGGCPFPAIRLKKHLPTKLFGYLSALPAVRNELAAFSPNLVNALYVGGYGLIGVLSGFHPVVVSAIGSDLLVDYRKNPVHRVQINHTLRRADLVTTDADVLTRTAVSAGAPRERIIKAYFGIDDTIFHPSTDPHTRPHEKTGIPHIVSTRNLYRVYNIDLLLDEAPAILERTDARFIICGDGPERARLEGKASTLGINASFIFRGQLSPAEVAGELRSAAVYVSTSISDSTSVSLLEAMACGAPPVVTDLEANREWITDGENGLLVPADSPGALAEAVTRTIADSAFALEVRKNNFEVIKDRGLWNPNMEAVEMAFKELIGQQPAS